MVLNNEFQVDAPLARAWQLFEELERVIPCMPGATFDGEEAGASKVGIKVKVGAILADFRGTVRILERQETTHTVTLQGSGKDVGGKGQAAATIHVELASVSPETTRGHVKTDLGITGRLAQFGGGTIVDIAGRVIRQFTDNLNMLLAAEQGSAADGPKGAGAQESGLPPNQAIAATEKPVTVRAGTAFPPSPAKSTEPLDLGAMVGEIAMGGMRRYALVAVVFFVAGFVVSRLL